MMMTTEDRDDLSTLVEVDVQSSVDVKINANRFLMLCDNVENCFYEIDNSMFEILELKDKLLLQYLPRNVLLQITLVLSRFYRAYSQSQVPVYELIRLVQLYSESFDIKYSLLKRLYDSNETKKRMLNLALQKITSMENNTKHYQEQKCIDHWEKMYIRLALPRSNVRKWKFRIKTFREKAELGYEHVIEWIHVRIPRPSLTLDILPNKDPINDEDADRFEIVNVQETNESKLQTDHDSNHDDESNLLTENSKSKQIDIEIQVQPDSDDQQTSTEDILSTKSIIMRIYRPMGIAKTKFQCIVYAQGRKYTTKMLIFNKLNAPPTTGSRITKTKKRNEVSTTSDNNDINTIDKQQFDEIFIPMPNVLKRRSLFQTDIDPDAIKIEVFGDEKLYGSLILSSEDLLMLDLPNLHNQIFSPLIAIDDNISTDFDQTSNELYQLWISRTPHFFSIYNNKYEPIGKLPLLMFWYNKFENIHATKSTMTDLMETRIPTPPKLVSSEKIEIIVPPDETNSVDDHIEILKATYEDEISKIHEYYHIEIHRLTNLLNKILSGQMIETAELDENTLEIIQENTESRQPPPQREVAYGKDLPKKFLDRYEMYLQRSIINRHQLITKIEQQTALVNERQMEIQHRLYKPEQNTEYHDDLCLPAVFMPFRSGNIFNPRAYQYFHPVGSTAPRLTQAPSILKFPSLPSRSVSVLNLFELSQKYENSNEKNRPKTQTSD